MVVFAVMLIIAANTLPDHTIVIWDATGKKALAAAREDFSIGVLISGLIVLAIYLVAAVLMAVTPRRHVLVPNAVYWKVPARVGEMRHRYATYLGRAIGMTYVFLAAEVTVTIVSQHNKALQVWWLPSLLSLLFVIALLIFAVWVFADGFRPPPRPATTPRRAPSSGRG